MGYCTNCGKSTNLSVPFCPYCFLDPNIPENILDQKIRKYSISRPKDNFTIEYPGERTSLALAIVISLLIGIAFSAITLGVFFLFLIIGLIFLKLKAAYIKASYVRASKNSYQNIYNLGKVTSFRLGIPLYPIFIELNPSINAYTSGFWGDHWIVLYSGLINHLSENELLFVLGHEMGHIKREHTTWLNLASPTSQYSLPIISDLLKIIFNNWNLKAEFSADRAGLVATKDLKTCISSLIKLVGEKDSIKIEEYLKEFEKKSADPLFKIGEYFRDHPYIPNRIKKLQDYARN